MNRRVVVVSLLAGACGLVGLWRAQAPGAWLSPASPVATANEWHAASPVATATTSTMSQRLAPAPPRIDKPSTAPALASMAQAEEHRDRPVWDLCGVGRMPAPAPARLTGPPDRPFYTLPAHLGEDALEQALGSLNAALESGPPRWRAAAWVLRGVDNTGRSSGQALAEVAQTSADPVLAMWALQTCHRSQNCNTAIAQHWADLEPDNLVPWMWMMQLAPANRQDEIFSRMGSGLRHLSRPTALLAVVLEAMPASLPPYLQAEIWVRMIGVELAMPGPGYNPLLARCPEKMPADGEPYRRCAAIGRAMVESSDTALGVALGLRLAERTYLSKLEAKAQREALNSISQTPNKMFDEKQPMSCESVRRLREWSELRARQGELGAWQTLATRNAASAANPPR